MSLRQLKIFLASSSELESDRKSFKDFISDENTSLVPKGLNIKLIMWEVSFLEALTEDGLQNEYNKEISQCDIFIMLFFSKVGKYTNQEFEVALKEFKIKKKPLIFIYEKDGKISTKKMKEEDIQSLFVFRKKIDSLNHYYRHYENSDNLNFQFKRQLEKYLAENAPTHIETIKEEIGEAPTDREIPSAAKVETFNVPAMAYHELIGRTSEIKKIMSALKKNVSTRGILITGLGGIGKTALAREVVELCNESKYFTHIIWASFKMEQFVGGQTIPTNSVKYSFDDLLSDVLRQIGKMNSDQNQPPDIANAQNDHTRSSQVLNLLKKYRALIVLDNLETIPRSEELVARIFEILGKSKLLITSRHQVMDDRLLNIGLGGISKGAGITFLRKEGKTRGIETVAKADETTLRRIYDGTGGAPLAMKLVVGQLSRQPIEVVLNRLKEASVRGPDYQLYRFIYRDSWKILDLTARMVLVDMSVFLPLTGGAVNDVESISQVGGKEFWVGMDELVRLSLVDKSGKPGEERFFLHPLTWNFIRSDITREKEWTNNE